MLKNNFLTFKWKPLKREDEESFFKELALQIQKENPQLTRKEMVQALLTREELGSTYIGDSTMLLHVMTETITSSQCLIWTTPLGVLFPHFEKNGPIHNFIVLVTNSDGRDKKVFLPLLAKISHSEVLKKITQINNQSELNFLLEGENYE